MSPRLATVSAFAYTLGAGLLLGGLYLYGSGPGGASPEHESVRLATGAILLGALFLVLPAPLRRRAALRMADRAGRATAARPSVGDDRPSS